MAPTTDHAIVLMPVATPTSEPGTLSITNVAEPARLIWIPGPVTRFARTTCHQAAWSNTRNVSEDANSSVPAARTSYEPTRTMGAPTTGSCRCAEQRRDDDDLAEDVHAEKP
jgi:hypothetical protein